MRDNRCPECKMGAFIVAYRGKIWMECSSRSCGWATMKNPVVSGLAIELDRFVMRYLAQVVYAEIEKKQNDASKEDQYATAEDIFGVLESVNENRRRIVDLEKKLEHIICHIQKTDSVVATLCEKKMMKPDVVTKP